MVLITILLGVYKPTYKVSRHHYHVNHVNSSRVTPYTWQHLTSRAAIHSARAKSLCSLACSRTSARHVAMARSTWHRYPAVLKVTTICRAAFSKVAAPLKKEGYSCRFHMLPHVIPIGSMYGIYIYIYPKNGPNVGKYSIHGANGLDRKPRLLL